MENGMIYKQISQIMRECPAIEKNQRNSQQGYAYRGIDDAMNTLQNLLPKYGVFYVPEVLESHREERTTAKGGNLIYSVLKVKYTFYAEDGSHIAAVVQSEGMDSADKSSNKAMSAACKYALFQVFNIPTKEFVDPDATTPEPSKASEKPVMATADYPGDIEVLKTFSLPENFNTYGLNLETDEHNYEYYAVATAADGSTLMQNNNATNQAKEFVITRTSKTPSDMSNQLHFWMGASGENRDSPYQYAVTIKHFEITWRK